MKWYNIVEKSLAFCWKRNSMILGEKLPKFDLSLYENLVEKEKEENEINLEGIIPGNSREDINWRVAAMYARKLGRLLTDEELEKFTHDNLNTL